MYIMDSKKLKKSYETLKYNIEYSGYDLLIPFDKMLKELQENSMCIFKIKHKTVKDRDVLIVYNMVDKMTLNNVNSLILELQDKGKLLDKDLLYVVVPNMTTPGLLSLREKIKMADTPVDVSIVDLNMLSMVIILQHTYVPHHKVLLGEEKTQFLDKYNITSYDKLPEIGRDDPVALSIFMRPDDICEISRTDKSTMKQKYYRVCI